MTQAHDYKAALEFIEDKYAQDYIEGEEYYHIFKYYGETIRHALAMMAKLQEPSEGMLETMKQIIWNNTWSRDNCQFHIARLLEQAEKEIEG